MECIHVSKANRNGEVCKTDYPGLRFVEGWIIIHN